MKYAPSIIDYHNDYTQDYYTKVKKYLDAMNISYVIDPTLVRGLDYYNHTAFEIMSDHEGFGAITTLLGGGRYNGLTSELGGPDVPGIGFGMGLERLMLALETEGVELPVENELDAFIVTFGEEVTSEAVKITQTLRENNIQVDKDYQRRKPKGQFKEADRVKAKYVLILGEDELEKDRKSTRLNSSHVAISYAVSCLK